MNQTITDLGELISITEAAQYSGFSPDHIRRLIEQGKVWGKKIGRNWVTTKAAVEEYKHQRHPRGPKSKKK